METASAIFLSTLSLLEAFAAGFLVKEYLEKEDRIKGVSAFVHMVLSITFMAFALAWMR